jgi:hypothetical protein
MNRSKVRRTGGSGHRASRLLMAGTLVLTGAACGLSVRAEAGETKPPADDFSIPDADRGTIDVDTGNLFGFSDGSDVQSEGEKELSTSLVTRWGKRGDGSAPDARGAHATMFDTATGFEYGITDRLSVAFNLFGTGRDQSGLAGFDNRHFFNFNGGSTEISYGLLQRSPENPFGLKLSFEPSWNRFDDVDGSSQTSISGEVKLTFDWRVLPGQLWYALNVGIEPSYSRASDGSVDHQSEVTISNALSARVLEQTYLGIEAGYHRANDGMLADHFLGDALYVGPTLFHKINKSVYLAAAFQTQVAGHQVDPSPQGARLDLYNFDRNRAMLTLGFNF